MEENSTIIQHPIKVAITGPECTGKTTLAKELANHYNTVWVPEFARKYIDNLDRPYAQKDLDIITKGQLSSEAQLLPKANKILICDTELLVIKVWSEYKYRSVSDYILNQYKHHEYDLYILTDTDIRWEQDSQREHPEKRDYFFKRYKEELESMECHYTEASGSLKERVSDATSFIDRYINHSQKAHLL